MDKVFDVKDKTGRMVYLSNERWRKHILVEHPYLSNRLEDVKKALMMPTTILSSKYDENVRYYFLWCKESAEYIMVAVKYLNGTGFVITSYCMKNLKK